MPVNTVKVMCDSLLQNRNVVSYMDVHDKIKIF